MEPVVGGGGVCAVTVTVKLPLAVLPRVSLAEQLTVVVAIGKVEPEAGVQLTGRGPSTASIAEAVKVTTLPEELVASAVILAGRVSTGFTESICHEMLAELGSTLPAGSVAVTVKVWTPSARPL